jgi:hypothetical protein
MVFSVRECSGENRKEKTVMYTVEGKIPHSLLEHLHNDVFYKCKVH